MHTKNTPQTALARRDAPANTQAHLSIEAYHKLNRANAVSQFVGLDVAQRETAGLHQLCMPHIFSYLHDDISFVLEELKTKGLCRDFLVLHSPTGGECHV